METKLMDSTHGWSSPHLYHLEQYWLVGDVIDGDVIRITIDYVPYANRKLESKAELVCISGEVSTREALLVMREFPSTWWRQFVPGNDVSVPPEPLMEVSERLLERYSDYVAVLNEEA